MEPWEYMLRTNSEALKSWEQNWVCNASMTAPRGLVCSALRRSISLICSTWYRYLVKCETRLAEEEEEPYLMFL